MVVKNHFGLLWHRYENLVSIYPLKIPGIVSVAYGIEKAGIAQKSKLNTCLTIQSLTIQSLTILKTFYYESKICNVAKQKI